MIFLSYKSDNVNLVRPVAEAIFSSGYKVWFAEYYILMENYSVFRQAIDKGIESSDFALLFTNKQWNESKHCQYERAKVIRQVNPKNCMEVVINEKKRYLESFCDSHIFLSMDGNIPGRELIGKLLVHISSIFHLKIKSLYAFPLGQKTSLSNMGIQLHTGPMEARITDNQRISQSFILPMVQFKAQVPEGEIGLSLQVVMFDSVLSEISQSAGNIHDDRELYRKYMDYAQEWIRNYNTGKEARNNIIMEARGLHLFFKNQCSHFGLTYACFDRRKSDPNTIERRFVVPIEGDIHGEKGEISFLFYGKFSGPIESQLKNFSRYSLFFEEVIESFKYATPKGGGAILNNFPVVVSKSIYLAGFLFLNFYFWFNSNYGYAFIASLMTGILVRDFIMFIRLKLYKRMMWSTNTVEDNLSQSTYEQLSVTTFTQIFVNPILLAFGIARSFPSIPKKFLTAVLWLAFCTFLFIEFTFPFTYPIFGYIGMVIGLITGLNFGKYVVSNIISRITKVDKKNIS